MRKVVAIFIFLFGCFIAPAQTDSSHLRISLITCGPGEDLYSIWGHSAIRVTDTTTHADRVYNYGTFDFYDPDFYIKFVRGGERMQYFLSVESFQSFLSSYREEKRSVHEQVLNLSGEEKITLYKALINNAKDENKFYRYDFLFDNCATRIRDIIRKHSDTGLVIHQILDKPKTFRELIHVDLNRTGMYWSKFGIDILLGSRLDKTAQNEQTMFLPVYLAKGFDSTYFQSKYLVKAKAELYQSSLAESDKSFFTPFVAFTILLVLFIVFAAVKNKIVLTSLDFLLFLSTGLLGILLVLMWTATDHALCKDNYNLLWALPFHTIAAFFIRSKNSRIKKYWLATAVINILLLAIWFFLPQQLNNGLIPLIVLLAWRSYALYRM
ncbi:MAG: DUF4105 domain-containing protein [Terrimonas sp.]|nr:DUF4105 domain-containing protein [Terrimonas sp.]OJY90039.1 MAG: hypothetical protein BGP13_23250 [Sphingobacteriales bacterium 40-81]